MATRPKKVVSSKAEGMKKTCTKCTKRVDLTSYYSNKESIESHFKDLWCSSCVNKFVTNLETLKEYCYFNNRMFSEKLYEDAELNIDNKISSDEKYNSLKDVDKIQQYRFDKVKKYFFSKMNMTQNYSYVNNMLNSDKDIKTLEAKIYETKRSNAEERHEAEETEYDVVWFGDFTKKELKFLNNYFTQLEKQFDISDIHIQDNARSVAKAALEKNQAFDAMRRNESGASSRYKNACDNYVKLSDMAKLSASKRTSNDTTGFGALGILINYMEHKGFLQKEISYTEDDVDRGIKYTQNILASLEGETFGGDK